MSETKSLKHKITTIKNCFRHAGISQQSQESATKDSDAPFRDLNEELDEIREIAPDLISPEVSAATVTECDNDVLTSDS